MTSFDLNYYGTESQISQNQDPLPDMCHKCGKCCRSATTYNSYKKLLEMVEEGEQEAIDFLESLKKKTPGTDPGVENK